MGVLGMRRDTSHIRNTNLLLGLVKSFLVVMLLVFASASTADSDPISDRGTTLVRWIEIEPGEQPRAYRNFDECVIYAPDPRWVAWTGSLGHEIAHCFAGPYHPQSGHTENWGWWNEKKKTKKAREG